MWLTITAIFDSCQAPYGLFTHTLDLFYDPGTHLSLMRLFLSNLWLIYLRLRAFFTARVLPWLGQFSPGVIDSILAQRKASEEEGENRIFKKALFGFFAILVHGVADRLEFYTCSIHQFLDLLFLKMMWKHDWEHSRCVNVKITCFRVLVW